MWYDGLPHIILRILHPPWTVLMTMLNECWEGKMCKCLNLSVRTTKKSMIMMKTMRKKLMKFTQSFNNRRLSVWANRVACRWINCFVHLNYSWVYTVASKDEVQLRTSQWPSFSMSVVLVFVIQPHINLPTTCLAFLHLKDQTRPLLQSGFVWLCLPNSYGHRYCQTPDDYSPSCINMCWPAGGWLTQKMKRGYFWEGIYEWMKIEDGWTC